MTVPDKAGKNLQIGDQRVGPRPQPVSRRGPEPPLVIGIGRDAPGGEEGARRGEEIGIIVEPVQRDKDCLGRALLRLPAFHR